MERFKAFGISTIAFWDLYHFIAIADTIAYFVLHLNASNASSARRISPLINHI
jgi:hypothetical protein